MERNKGADEFVNCVVHRGDKDMMIKPWLFLAALLVPLIMGTGVSMFILWNDSQTGYIHFPADSYDDCLMVVAAAAFATEAALSSFMIFCVARRNRNHLKRDAEWMSALCDYVDSHKGSSDSMRKAARKCSSIINGPITKMSMAMWIVLMVAIVGMGVWFHQMDSNGDNNASFGLIAMTGAPVLFLLIIQFVLTFGSVLGFPARHDKIQATFTEELEKQCALFGLRVDRMEHKVLRRDLWIHLILLIVTLGLYSFVYLFVSCKDMNAHLVEQWAYEEDLMRRIIAFEGGLGIEACDDGAGKASKVLSNLL